MSYHGSWILSAAILADVHLRSVRADCYARDGVLASESPSYSDTEPFSCGRGTNNCCLSDEQCNDQWIIMNYCGYNIYCDSSSDTCCETGPTYFIDPMTGEVKNASEDGSNFVPTWWGLVSTSLPATVSTIYPQSTDFVSTTSSLATSSASETSTTSPSSQSTPQPHTHLSPSATVGIGVGCGVAVIAVGILAWLLIFRRKKSKSQDVIEDSAYVPPEHQASMVATEKYPQMSYVQPYGEHEVTHELDEGRPMAELHSNVVKNEGSKQ
ncbi:hypothetical protein COCMIDRAFT_38519 [Bipolaris oryzae ATCC 44560]|uniref:Mid2 domain-containing protein n=1 Tax=Bipolaris oryzae ATCC 44560 TaxID=930090 RepID=W6Z1J4_COCMI|nr:uncharacterized protein COCMIDRAFT_38519 [Bipolaris oryzae ATCC 44560]EUC43583.1 hypothetical protein COCMIDRAFT_38519 [Bipolaris oryzae ATCC 44560]